MANFQLVDYLKLIQTKGLNIEEVKNSLHSQGWNDNDIADATRELEATKNKPLVPLPPKKSDWNIELNHINAPQLLVSLGGITIAVAAVIYVTLNWAGWNAPLRMTALFLPMMLMFGIGWSLWRTVSYRNYALIFSFIGALLFPLFLIITFNELHLWSSDRVVSTFIISALSFFLYVGLRFVFPSRLWIFLYCATGSLSWYYLWRSIGLKNFMDDSLITYFMLPLVLFYGLVGYMYEKQKNLDYAQYPYFFAVLTFVVVFAVLGLKGDIIRPILSNFVIPSTLHIFDSELTQWSIIIVGLVYLLVAWQLLHVDRWSISEPKRYIGVLNLFGTFAVLNAVFLLSLGGKKLGYEFLLLFTSIAFIFASIVRLSKAFLYLGFLYLIIFIFDIGFEYFKDSISWPIILFVAGALSMAAGLGMEKIRKRFFLHIQAT